MNKKNSKANQIAPGVKKYKFEIKIIKYSVLSVILYLSLYLSLRITGLIISDYRYWLYANNRLIYTLMYPALYLDEMRYLASSNQWDFYSKYGCSGFIFIGSPVAERKP